jgi:hypothetical protein
VIQPTGRVQTVSQPIARPWTPGEDSNPWFWNPGRIGLQHEPQWFRKLLDENGHQDISCVWNRNSERWQVFARSPRVQTKICQGWRYLFPVQLRNGAYAPLDERTLAKIFLLDGVRVGDGNHFIDRVASEMKRDKERAEQRDEIDTRDSTGEFFDYTLPKVGYGAISSSKVVGQ